MARPTRMIGSAIPRGNVVYVYDEKGSSMFSLNAGGQFASDGLQGYTPSTLSIRRGSTVYTYNERGQSISQHPTGPPVPKNKPTPPARIAPPPRPRNSDRALDVPSRSTKTQPLIETEEEIDTAHFDFEDDPGADDDVQTSEMAEAIPDEVRGLILTLERRRRRWKILAITFMILFSLPLLLIILVLAVGK